MLAKDLKPWEVPIFLKLMVSMEIGKEIAISTQEAQG